LALAKELGLDGVQVDFGKDDAELPLTSSELQQRFLSASKEHGVEIASLALGVLNDIPYKSDPRAEKWVLEAIGVCQVFGVMVALLAFFGNGDLRGDKEGTDEVVKRLKAAAPKAEEAGVVLGIESWLSAEEHLAILDRVGSPSVQVYYDVGNSHHIGHDIYAEIPQLGAERICEFHAKDYDDLYGKGSIDFPRVREAVDAIGYRGWIVIEGIELPLGLEESIRYDAEYLRKIFTNNG
jgi:sugar phosphate isomerase/epimerase